MLQGHFPTVRHCLLVIYQITQSLYELPGISEKDSFRTIEAQRVIDRCSSVLPLYLGPNKIYFISFQTIPPKVK